MIDSPLEEHAPVREIESSPPKNLGKKIGQLIPFLLLFGLLAIIGSLLLKVQAGPKEQGQAPDFTLISFEDETITLSELKGQVVVLNFWASWCGPCREEAAYLESISRKYEDQGVVFIGLNYVDTDKKALAYLEEFAITYFNGVDFGTRISQDYNIQGVPETFYIDKAGVLRGVHIGPLYAPTLELKIEELLAEPYSPNDN